MHRDTNDKREIISRNPVPMADCEDIMLRVVVFESTQTQASSKYFLHKAHSKVTNRQKYQHVKQEKRTCY